MTRPRTRTLLGVLVIVASTTGHLAGCRSYYLVDEELDAGDAQAGGGMAACAPSPGGSPPLFCDDFDQPPFGAKWDDRTVDRGGLSTARFRSAPNALRIRLEGEENAADYLAKWLGVSATSDVRVELDLFIERGDAVLPFGLFCGDKGYNLALDLAGRVVENGGLVAYTAYPTISNVVAGRWTHIDFFFRRSRGTVELTLDGERALGPTTLAGTATSFAGDCRLLMGLFFAPRASDWLAHYDNVRVTGS